MSAAMDLVLWASFPFLSFVEIFVACLLFAWHQPRRDGMPTRLAITIGCFALLALAIMAIPYKNSQIADALTLPAGRHARSDGLSIAVQTIGFGAFLIAMLPALMWCFDMSVWSALFCAMAGYTLQNFGSGLGELVLLTAARAGHPLPPWSVGIVGLLGCALAYLVAYQPLVREVSHANLDEVADRSLLPMLAVVILAVIGFDVVLKTDAFDAANPGVAIMTRVFHGIFCLFTLFVELDMVVRRKLALDAAMTTRLMAEHERQLQLSQETIDAINLKCHDLRHQIRHLADGNAVVDAAVLADAAQDVSVYDSVVHTGNPALDTILTEKSLLCEQSGATLTCVADGQALGFMAPADLYALFGNALDNALEATAGIDDPARRSISVLVRKRAGMAQVHIENTCADGVRFVGDLPQTSKLAADGTPDTANHGFGTRSMRTIVERYGGTLTLTPGNGTFSLDAMIPLA